MAGCDSSHHNNPGKTITLGFAGDVMIGRTVNEVVAKNNYHYVWGNMIEQLKQQDLMIINLETTFTKSIKKVHKVFNFKADPDKVQALVEAGIDIVCLANNHSLDFNIEGLLETIDVLDKANIKHVGAGKNAQEAAQPVIIEKHGIKIGIIGFTDNEPGWQAGADKPGTNYFDIGDIEKVRHDIKEVREQVDVLIATMHWGPNKRERPTQEFINFAHAMIDAGIDIIHGHSAHMVQGIEIYKNKVIMYDTGDFVDDYMVGPVQRNDLSFLFQVIVSKHGSEKITLTPVLIDNMQVNKVTGDDQRYILDHMKQLCHEMGTVIKEKEGMLEVNINTKPL